MRPAIYIMASAKKGTLYIGVTSNLIHRVWQHKEGVCEGFTKKYAVKQLVYYELHETIESAILRERQLKKWHRQWKLNLIHGLNPNWYDLWESIAEV